MYLVPRVQLETADSSDLTDLRTEITALRGRILNLHRVLANSPAALRAFMVMSKHVRNESSLPDTVRELAILTVAHTVGNPYEIGQHEPIALKAGLREDQLKALDPPAQLTSFSQLESVVVRYAADVTAPSRSVSEASKKQLATHFTPEQIVDLAVTVGWYHLCHVIIESLGVEIESVIDGR